MEIDDFIKILDEVKPNNKRVYVSHVTGTGEDFANGEFERKMHDLVTSAREHAHDRETK
jgi:hypothetical protein